MNLMMNFSSDWLWFFFKLRLMWKDVICRWNLIASGLVNTWWYGRGRYYASSERVQNFRIKTIIKALLMHNHQTVYKSKLPKVTEWNVNPGLCKLWGCCRTLSTPSRFLSPFWIWCGHSLLIFSAFCLKFCVFF